MFNNISTQLSKIFDSLTNRGTLSERDIEDAIKKVKFALLEADTNYKVTKQLADRLKQRCTGEKVYDSLTPGQTVIKIIRDEICTLLQSDEMKLRRSPTLPTVYLVMGMPGSGKTTTLGKLAKQLKSNNKSVLMAACDLKRPGATEQLEQIGNEIDVQIYSNLNGTSTSNAKAALAMAQKFAFSYLLIDTAGQDAQSDELRQIAKVVKPTEKLYVMDGSTGQSALTIANDFNESVGITGIIVTKMDGDARGGAILSLRYVTNIPVKYVGVGEHLDDLMSYNAERLTSRIMGMGDVETLIEKAQTNFETDKINKLEQKLAKNRFDFVDMLEQLKHLKKLGPIQSVVNLLPIKGLKNANFKDSSERLKKFEAIILSMTPTERATTKKLNISRRKRITAGSGTSLTDLNLLIKQHKNMTKMLTKLKSGDSRNMMKLSSQWKNLEL